MKDGNYMRYGQNMWGVMEVNRGVSFGFEFFLIGFEGGEFQSRVASRAVVDNNLLFIQVPFVVGLAATNRSNGTVAGTNPHDSVSSTVLAAGLL